MFINYLETQTMADFSIVTPVLAFYLQPLSPHVQVEADKRSVAYSQILAR